MALEIEQLKFDYGSGGFSLRIPSLRIAPGEAVVLVGPSGSGKTTLLKLVAGILAPDQGRITLNSATFSGLGISGRRQRRIKEVGMIFQTFELLDYLDVRDNILLQARLAPGVRIDAVLERQAQVIADELGLKDKWSRSVAQLSQGERQRVAVARALLLDPPLVLADEPTGNLDPANKQAVLEQLLALCARDGRMLLTVTHDHALLPAFDRVLDMADLTEESAT